MLGRQKLIGGFIRLDLVGLIVAVEHVSDWHDVHKDVGKDLHQIIGVS